jgi:hypothetical protein
MMKMLMVALLVCLYAGVCYAQPGGVLQGKIKSLTAAADAAKGIKSEIAVTDAAGQVYNFLVKSTTTIYDPEFKAIGLAVLKADMGVKVKFTTTKEGVREAVSVSELK